MNNPIQPHSVGDMQNMARAFVDSRMFGVQNLAEALSLLLIAQGEGLHPATAMQQYHVIQGRPALKADAMLARFQQACGVVEWTEITDDRVAAKFSHPTASPQPVMIEWTNETVAQAQLGGNPMHKKYPRQMKRARVISEGVRTVYPAAISGFYAPEEVVDFEPNREPPPEIVQSAATGGRGVIQKGDPEWKQQADGFDLSKREPDDELDERINGPREIDPKHEVPVQLKGGRSTMCMADLDRKYAERALKIADWRLANNPPGRWHEKNEREAQADRAMLIKLLAEMPPAPAPAAEDSPSGGGESEPPAEAEGPKLANGNTKIFVRQLGDKRDEKRARDMSDTDLDDAMDAAKAALDDPTIAPGENIYYNSVISILESERAKRAQLPAPERE